MDTTRSDPSRLRLRLRDWLLFPALLLYLGALVTSAVVPEIRPAFLDRPYRAALQML